MEEIIKNLVGNENIILKKYQYVLTETRHIKLRKKEDNKNFGEAYLRAESLINNLNIIHTPKVIEVGNSGDYEYVMTERIEIFRETERRDIEKILNIMELTKTNNPPFKGCIYDRPVFLIDHLNNGRTRVNNMIDKLRRINYDEDNIEIIKNISNKCSLDSFYQLQHGDLCYRNIIISNNEKIYLTDLDTLGYYPSHFERVYLCSNLGIPVSMGDISDEVMMLESAIIVCLSINDKTMEIKSVVEASRRRINLIIMKRIGGLQNVLSGIGLGRN